MRLSGEQFEKLSNALTDAFPDKSSLEQMLWFKLNKNLTQVTGVGNLGTVVFELIKVANSQGWVEDLVRKAYEYNSGNQGLRAIVEEILPNHALETPSVSSPNILQKQSNQPQKILILAAIPYGLRLDKEIREIESAIQRATNRDLFEIKIKTAVRPQDIRRAIAEEQPQIVHFCGHGEKDGSLLLEDDGGNNKPVAPEGLASLFKLHADYVKCVLLNACYSEKPAVAISQYINYVIGMNNPIQDSAAIEFAKGFYDGLGYKISGNQDVFQRAFDEGMVAIEMENLSQGSIPVWKKNSAVGTDPKKDAIAEYRKKVEEFLADDAEISFVESKILNDLQEQRKLTDDEARAVRNEVLKPFGIYKQKLDKYKQVFTKLVNKQGYPLGEKDKAELKKLQQYHQLKDEDITLLEKEAEQQQDEKLRQQQEAERQQRQREQEEASRRQQPSAYTTASKPAPSNNLSSERYIDYTRLRDLLEAGQLKEANQETIVLMLKTADREKEGWLDDKSINNFPCTDLRTIDQLWVKYSSGRFGFSVQKCIWQNVRVTKAKDHLMALVYANDSVADAESFEYFSDRIGWQSLNRYIGDHELIFSKEAPEGHLPVFGFFKPFWRTEAFGHTFTFMPFLAQSGRLCSHFFSRLDACEYQQVK